MTDGQSLNQIQKFLISQNVTKFESERERKKQASKKKTKQQNINNHRVLKTPWDSSNWIPGVKAWSDNSESSS